MLRISELILKVSMILAVLVAVATAGLLLVIGTPQATADKNCHLSEPFVEYESDAQREQVFLASTAPNCALDSSRSMEYSVTFNHTNQGLEGTPDVVFTSHDDGSYKQLIHEDSRKLVEPLRAVVRATAINDSECGDHGSCAAMEWNVLIEPQS